MEAPGLDIEKLKFPIGYFKAPSNYDMASNKIRIKSIETLPDSLNTEFTGLSEEQLNTPYRPNGWTVRQLIHHIADSHMNAFTRFKLGLTEENPTIRPYDQNAWCDMKDAQLLDPKSSLNIINGVHERWSYVLNGMSETDFQRNIFHPEMKKSLHLGRMLALYSWHSDHHLAHITGLKERKAWL